MTPEAMREIRDRLDGITCPLCKGTRIIKSSSFVDSSKTVEKSCRMCNGKGTLPACAEDLVSDIRALLDAVAERDALLDILREVHASDPNHTCIATYDIGGGNIIDHRCSLCKKIDALKEGENSVAAGDKAFGGPEWRDGLELDYKALVLERWPDARIHWSTGNSTYKVCIVVDSLGQQLSSSGRYFNMEDEAWKSAYERMGE